MHSSEVSSNSKSLYLSLDCSAESVQKTIAGENILLLDDPAFTQEIEAITYAFKTRLLEVKLETEGDFVIFRVALEKMKSNHLEMQCKKVFFDDLLEKLNCSDSTIHTIKDINPSIKKKLVEIFYWKTFPESCLKEKNAEVLKIKSKVVLKTLDCVLQQKISALTHLTPKAMSNIASQLNSLSSNFLPICYEEIGRTKLIQNMVKTVVFMSLMSAKTSNKLEMLS